MNKQLFISILLIVLMSMAGEKAFAYDIVVANSDGVNIYYNYINNGTDLEVTCERYTNPVYPYSGTVAIPEEVTYMNRTRKVTSIGKGAFKDCKRLYSVSIPNSVTIIKEEAFFGCISDDYKEQIVGLTSITIGNGVKTIEKKAFDYCTQLSSVYISDISAWCRINFAEIYSNPLYYAHHLYMNDEEIKKIDIPNDVTSIGNYAFAGCSDLTSVIIPSSVNSIGIYAFSGCTHLVYLTISNGVTSIDKNAFGGCTHLTSLTIPNTVTSIGDNAFSGCSGLISVTIPNSVTSIGNGTFSNCDIPTVISLIKKPFKIAKSFSQNTLLNATLIVPAGTIELYRGTEGWKDFVFIEEGSESVDNPEDNDNSTITGRCGQNANFTYDNATRKLTISGSGPINDYGGGGNDAPWSPFANEILEIEIESGITAIGNSNFYNCSNITSMTIPESVKSIGQYAFDNCTSLISLNIRNGVTSIGFSAFYGCTNLTSVAIPNSVTSIGQHAFQGCTNLTSITIPQNVTEIGSWAFLDTGLRTVISLIENPFDLGDDNDFIDGPDLGFPFSQETINYGTLYVLAGSLEKYKNKYGWRKFKNIKIATTPYDPNCVWYNFQYTDSAMPVSLKKMISVISGNDNMSQIDSNYTEKGEIPQGCSKGAFVMGRNGGGIRWMFDEGVNILLVNLHFTGKRTFKINYTLSNGISGSKEVSYTKGTYLDVDVLELAGLKDKSLSIRNLSMTNSSSTGEVRIYDMYIRMPYLENPYNSSCGENVKYTFNKTTHTLTIFGEGEMKNYGNGSAPWSSYADEIETIIIEPGVTSIGNSAFINCIALSTISIPNSLTSIGSDAFNGCIGLTSVIIPNSMTSIGEAAFSYTGLISVSIPSSVTSIGNSTFCQCYWLTSVTIPDNVTSIGDYAFSYCEDLTTISFPSSVTSIGEHAFFMCKSLTSVTIPNSVTSIGRAAFQGTPWLNNQPDGLVYINNIAYLYKGEMPNNTRITILPGTLSIGKFSFSGCSNMTSIIIPNSVTSINEFAFRDCIGLNTITIPNSINSIGDCAFYDCINLNSIKFLGTTPPLTNEKTFAHLDKENCILWVPKGCSEHYKQAYGFADVREIGNLENGKGDVNSDGKVDKEDLNDLIAYIFGNIPNGVTKDSADVNGDDKVDVADVVVLLALIE